MNKKIDYGKTQPVLYPTGCFTGQRVLLLLILVLLSLGLPSYAALTISTPLATTATQPFSFNSPLSLLPNYTIICSSCSGGSGTNYWSLQGNDIYNNNDANVIITNSLIFPNGVLIGNDVRTAGGIDPIGIGYQIITCGDCTAIGYDVTAGSQSVAMGYVADAYTASLAYGYYVQSLGSETTAVGADAFATNESSSFGTGANAISESTSVGYIANAKRDSTAVGSGATATYGSTAVGYQTTALSSAIAIGWDTYANYEAIADGYLGSANNSATELGGYGSANHYAIGVGYSVISDYNGTAVGNFANASTNGTAIGDFAYAQNYSIAIGSGAQIPEAWQNTTEIGEGSPSLEGGFNYQGWGLLSDTNVVYAKGYVASGHAGITNTITMPCSGTIIVTNGLITGATGTC